MAIASFIVQTLAADDETRQRIEAGAGVMRGVSLHGWPKPDSLVAVADCPAEDLQELVRELSVLPGVVAVHVASLNMEDELLGQGACDEASPEAAPAGEDG